MRSVAPSPGSNILYGGRDERGRGSAAGAAASCHCFSAATTQRNTEMRQGMWAYPGPVCEEGEIMWGRCQTKHNEPGPGKEPVWWRRSWSGSATFLICLSNAGVCNHADHSFHFLGFLCIYFERTAGETGRSWQYVDRHVQAFAFVSCPRKTTGWNVAF